MILEDFLNGTQVEGDTFLVKDASKVRTFYKFLREAILDDHIPVWKVIGYTTTYTLPNHNIQGRMYGRDMDDWECKRELDAEDQIAITKDMALCECNVDLNDRFQHIILKNKENWPLLYSSFEGSGPMYSKDFQYPQSVGGTGYYNFTHESVKNETVKAVTDDDFLSPNHGPWMHQIGGDNCPEFIMYLYLYEGTGYMDAHDTNIYLPKMGELNDVHMHWFPFDQQFTLSEFVLVPPLPYDSTKIPVKLRYSTTMEFFYSRLQDWLKSYMNNNLNVKEQEWLNTWKEK